MVFWEDERFAWLMSVVRHNRAMHVRRSEPGLAPNLDFRGFTPDEERIAHQFATFFRVDFARVQPFKKRDYAFLLTRPTKDYLQSYILEDRELLVLFSRAEEFDGRLFDFVDRINSEYANRLDRLCMVLVGNGGDLASRVESYLEKQTEARLVIPISANEADESLEERIQERLSRFFFGRDLFAFSSPLKSDAYFYGRQGILQFLYDKYRSGENSGLFGLRKTGKTSVLHAVRRWLEAREEPAVIIDCQDSAVQLRPWNELLYYITERLIRVHDVGGLKSLLKPERYQPKNASVAFEDDLVKISHWFGDKRILLMFDEIESITFSLATQEHWRSGRDFLLFWQSIRAIYQRNPNLISFLLTGVNPHIIESSQVAGADNPVFRIVSPRYLEFFRYDEVEKMVRETGKYMGLQFEPEVISGLMTDYGGHPFLVRQACSSIHHRVRENRPFVVDRFFYASVSPDIERELQDYVSQIVSVLREHYAEEYELLEMLAVGNLNDFREWVDAAPKMIQHLKGYGLVTESRLSYHITIRCVQAFLDEDKRMRGRPSSAEQRRTEVSETRNALEPMLREAVRLVLLTNLGANTAKAEVLQRLLKRGQKERMAKLGFNEMFNSSDKELYWLDLQRIALTNWDKFHPVFGSEKAKFEQFCEVINKYRIDAHAEDMTDDELALFRIAADWLATKCRAFLASD